MCMYIYIYIYIHIHMYAGMTTLWRAAPQQTINFIRLPHGNDLLYMCIHTRHVFHTCDLHTCIHTRHTFHPITSVEERNDK